MESSKRAITLMFICNIGSYLGNFRHVVIMVRKCMGLAVLNLYCQLVSRQRTGLEDRTMRALTQKHEISIYNQYIDYAVLPHLTFFVHE